MHSWINNTAITMTMAMEEVVDMHAKGITKWINVSRAGLVAVVIAGSLGGAPSTAHAAAPTAPADLRIEAYSSNTVEIFWSRSYDDHAVSGYELVRNGQTHWLGDVTSYLDNTIGYNESVTYNIVAVDADNNRSPWSSTLSFNNQNGNSTSCSGSSNCSSSSISISAANSNQVNQPGNPSLRAPERIRGDIYSDSALELFWDAVDGPLGVKGYDIYRNGELLTRTTGTSFFDSKLNAGTQYRYSVYTIDLNDQRSDDHTEIDLLTTGQHQGGGNSASSSVSHADSSGGNLTGRVWGETYSSRAAEVFWEYSGSDAISLFEVVRNGAIVKQTTGRSYYDESLGANTAYRFEIRAISGANSRVLGAVDLKTPNLW